MTDGTPPTATEARAVGITGDRWPYGPGNYPQARRDLVDWATPRRLRLKRNVHCLNWLRTGHCPHRPLGCPIGGWLDHVTAWTRDGEPAVLVAQPYMVAGDQLAALAEIDQSDDLNVIIDGTGWYGHRTTFIGIWRVDPHG